MIRTILLAIAGLVLVSLVLTKSILDSARRLKRRGLSIRPKPADVAIVLGAYTKGYQPGRVLSGRLRAGLHLYRVGYCQYFIVSGGKGSDETVAESSSMKRFLVLNGVPPEVILMEMTSEDTWENLKYSQEVMKQHDFKTAIIVTSDYHLARALAVAKQLGIEATGFASPSTRREWRSAVREVFARAKYNVSGQSAWRDEDV